MSHAENFAHAAAEAYSKHMFSAIVKGLAEMGMKVTLEELAEMCKIPAPRNTFPPAATVHAPFGGTSETKKQTTSRAAAPSARSSQNGIKGACQYIFKRGKKENLACGKACTSDPQYCSACLRRPQVLKERMIGKQEPAKQSTTEQEDVEKIVDLVPYDEANNRYREKDHGFIVELRDEEGIPYVHGVLEDDKIVPLKDFQKRIAASYEFYDPETNAIIKAPPERSRGPVSRSEVTPKSRSVVVPEGPEKAPSNKQVPPVSVTTNTSDEEDEE